MYVCVKRRAAKYFGVDCGDYKYSLTGLHLQEEETEKVQQFWKLRHHICSKTHPQKVDPSKSNGAAAVVVPECS